MTTHIPLYSVRGCLASGAITETTDYVTDSGWCYLERGANGQMGVRVFTNRDAAINRAEAMRQKRIASLHRQIEKLEGMRFI